MIQMRPQGGGLPYAPYRDIVNLFSHIVKRAFTTLEPGNRESWLEDLLKFHNTSYEDLAASVKVFAEFINKVQEKKYDEPVKLLKDIDFFFLNPGAVTAVLARIGQATMATFFASARDALRIDEKPCGLDELLKYVSTILDRPTTDSKDK